jgi:antitoxin component YwqK of YwqJK toxin-antitoxin module
MNREKDITNFNDNGQHNGFSKYYYPNGKLACKCFYINGKESGYEEFYYYTSENYCVKFNL